MRNPWNDRGGLMALPIIYLSLFVLITKIESDGHDR